MSNILGNPFKDWVKDQITARQKALGETTNISPEILKYYSNKAPWIRLSSAVNLTNEGPNDNGKKTLLENSVLNKLIKNGVPQSLLEEDALAKNFILQGGVVNNLSPLPQSGLNLNNELFKGDYGWGGTSERGYVPPPGITKINTQYFNNGSLTRTIIDIECFSKAQFQLIDVLYLRPGYTLLLEFGHSMYLDKDGNLNSFNDFHTEPLKLLLDPNGRNQYDLYKVIDSEREKYEGNYEAVYGKISKFSWNFTPNGSYSIQLQLTGMGDVIESLKLNISDPNIKQKSIGESVQNENSSEEKNISENPIISNANKTLLNQKLFFIYQGTQSSKDVNRWHYIIKGFNHIIDDFKGKDLKINNAILTISSVTSDIKNCQEQQTYITFGTLLAIIQSRIIPQDNKSGNKVPLVIFDIDFENLDNDKNYILKFPGQFSSNPNVCIVPFTNPNLNFDIANLDNITNSELNKQLSKGAKWEKSIYLGRLFNLYININFIAHVLDTLEKNEEGDIYILEFLQSIIKEITISLGGINKIKIQSSIDGKIQFYEEIPQKFDNEEDEDAPKDNFSKFNIYGVKPNVEGSFVKNVGLSADLGNEMATMIAIGAQSNSNQLTANATSFSTYNSGLQDRIIVEKQTPLPNNPSNSTEIDSKSTAEDILRYNINNIDNSLINSIYGGKNYNTENISALSSFNTQYAKLIIGELSKQSSFQQISSTAFIPFTLKVDIEGLSGMVLYQKFKIDSNALPPSYESDDIDLQLIGINHTVDNKFWNTQMNALSVPSSKYLTNSIAPDSTSETIPPDSPCGQKTILPSPIPILPFSNSRKLAIESSYNYVFNSFGEKRGMCARWVYNMALNYVNNLRLKNFSQQLIPSGGNAKQNIEFHRNLVQLGYTQHKIGYNINKADISNILQNTIWGYGDIVVYYSNNGDGNPYLYGHTQIYVGNISTSNWSTSTRTNYGTNFVYRDRSSECWDFIIFRAPSN